MKNDTLSIVSASQLGAMDSKAIESAGKRRLHSRRFMWERRTNKQFDRQLKLPLNAGDQEPSEWMERLPQKIHLIHRWLALSLSLSRSFTLLYERQTRIYCVIEAIELLAFSQLAWWMGSASSPKSLDPCISISLKLDPIRSVGSANKRTWTANERSRVHSARSIWAPIAYFWF